MHSIPTAQEIRQLYGPNPSNIFHRAILRSEGLLDVTAEEDEAWELIAKLQTAKEHLINK